MLVHPSTGERAPGGLADIGGSCEVPANCLSHACEASRCVEFPVHHEDGSHAEGGHAEGEAAAEHAEGEAEAAAEH